MKKSFNLPLFWKFTIAITGTVAFFGVVNLYFINYTVYDLFEIELTQHGKITATSIAERSIVPIAYNDLATLDRIVTDQKRIDPNIAYLFIVNKNKELLAHTFDQTVPSELFSANKISVNDSIYTVKIEKKNNPNVTIRDLAIPILQGSLGVVRIGLYEENYFKSRNQTTRIFIFMVAIFLIFGIIGAFIFSYVITMPIKTLSEISKRMELGSLDIQEEDFEILLNNSEIVRWKNFLNVTDEIDVLIYSFGEMVSRLKNTYLKLQKTQSSLFQSEKMASLGTLSAGIAHEINNPIAGMKSCVRRLMEAPENLKQNISYLDLINEALHKVENVVRGLLDFSRKPELSFSNTNVNSIIENVLLLTSYQLEKARISIHKDVDSQLSVHASSNHLEQVILNLVLNSIEAIEEKKLENENYGGEIYLVAKSTRNHISIEVSDNGIGLSNELLKEIFDPFFTRKKIKAGTGLGLAVSYSIIEQHRGSIRVKQNQAGGLSFFIRLLKEVKM